jgi:hypothetical protein
MADLVEDPVFDEGIYQIETTDPVIGGAPNVGTGAGMSNIPHQQLARRTRWLKEAIDNIVGSLTNFVTRPQFESTQRPATTEFVRREIGNLRGQVTFSATGALTAAHTGMRVLLQTNGTITLPSLASVPAGTVFLLVAALGYTPTIQASGADVIFVAGGSSTVTLPERSSLFLVAGAVNWNGDLGDFALTKSSLFDASLTNNGYQRLPSGLILQWGAGTTDSGGTVAMTFPIAFPTAVRQVLPTDQSAAANANNAHIVSTMNRTASGFTAITCRYDGTLNSSAFSYFAIGN